MPPEEYVFNDVATEPELRRLRAIEDVFDPATIRCLLTTGDWVCRHCLEVGAGAGSIARWMRSHTGPSGRVVAIDTHVRFLEPLRAQIEIVQGDVRDADVGAGAFDVAHARYVLVHNDAAGRILDAMIAAVRPGGWILVEEPDFTVARPFAGPEPLRTQFERVNAAIAAMFRDRELDPAFGQRLPALAEQRGLDLVTVECDAPVTQGTAPLAAMMALSAEQLRDKYIATGLASADDVAGYQAFAADPASWGIYYSTVRVLARKPA